MLNQHRPFLQCSAGSKQAGCMVYIPIDVIHIQYGEMHCCISSDNMTREPLKRFTISRSAGRSIVLSWMRWQLLAGVWWLGRGRYVSGWVGVFALIHCGSGPHSTERLTYILHDAFSRYIFCDWVKCSKPPPCNIYTTPSENYLIVCINVWAHIGQERNVAALKDITGKKLHFGSNPGLDLHIDAPRT